MKLDPRVRTPATVMREIDALSASLYDGAAAAQAAVTDLVRLRARAQALATTASGEAAQALASFVQRADSLRGLDSTRVTGSGGSTGAGPGGIGGSAVFVRGSLSAAAQGLVQVMNLLQAADVPPTEVQRSAIADARRNAAAAMARWHALETTELANLNARLRRAGMAELGVR